MRIPLPIQTGRLLIRRFDVDADTDAMTAVYCDPEVMSLIPGGALADATAVRAELARHVRRNTFWAVVERETGRVVGEVGLGVFAPTGDAELGYSFARQYWGRGYAAEAAAACLAAALERVPTVVAVVDAENERSLRLAERLGMTRIDTIDAHGRPHVLYSTSR